MDSDEIKACLLDADSEEDIEACVEEFSLYEKDFSISEIRRDDVLYQEENYLEHGTPPMIDGFSLKKKVAGEEPPEDLKLVLVEE